MALRVIQIPYDSGHRGARMGAGPLRIAEGGALDALRALDPDVKVVTLEAPPGFTTEIGSAFDLHRAGSRAVAEAARAGDLPLVLSGNCNSAIGTVSGLQATAPDEPVGVLWFDGHGDCNTPETFTGDFLDAMGLSTLTGRCWQALAATVPGFRPVPDRRIVLVGGHGMDDGARSVIEASGIGWIEPGALRAGGPAAAADRLRLGGATRLYVHLDVDAIDAAYAPANGFAPTGGLRPEEVLAVVEAADLPIAAAAVASYDPAFDRGDRILSAARAFLERVASRRP